MRGFWSFLALMRGEIKIPPSKLPKIGHFPALIKAGRGRKCLNLGNLEAGPPSKLPKLRHFPPHSPSKKAPFWP